MYYIVSEIYTGGRFLQDCFYCYSQQIISAVATEPLISFNLIQGSTNLIFACTDFHARKTYVNVALIYIV